MERRVASDGNDLLRWVADIEHDAVPGVDPKHAPNRRWDGRLILSTYRGNLLHTKEYTCPLVPERDGRGPAPMPTGNQDRGRGSPAVSVSGPPLCRRSLRGHHHSKGRPSQESSTG